MDKQTDHKVVFCFQNSVHTEKAKQNNMKQKAQPELYIFFSCILKSLLPMRNQQSHKKYKYLQK